MFGDELSKFIKKFDTSNEHLNCVCLSNALMLAKLWHDGQKRKITNEDYVVHPIEVAEILLKAGVYDVPIIAAALLHDVLEDCPASSRLIICSKCGPLVDSYVVDSTNHFDKSGERRAIRKAKEIERLSKCAEAVQNIKLADAISNLRTTYLFDEKFRKIYAQEKLMLAQSLMSGNNKLRLRVIELAEESLK